MRFRPFVICVGVGVGVWLAPAAARAATAPQLVARSAADGSAINPLSVRLDSIDAQRFKVSRSKSGDRVTLGYPRTGPDAGCATTTLRIRIVDGTDPLAEVRRALPTARTEGTIATSANGTTLSGPPTAFRGAWRSYFDILHNTQLVQTDVAARRVRVGAKGVTRTALRVVTLRGRTNRSSTVCAGAAKFTLGPGVDEIGRLAA